MYLFRLRNANDLEAVMIELSALLNKKTLNEVYLKATQERYSFLFIKLTEPDIQDMFYINLDKKIMINDK